MECSFCNIIENKILSFKLWEDEQFLLILDMKPINPGHLLLLPKIHVEDIFLMEEPEYTAIFQRAKKIVSLLKEVIGSPKVGLAIEGFGVPHVHVHLVPLFNGNELNPLRAQSATREELEEMAQVLRLLIIKSSV